MPDFPTGSNAIAPLGRAVLPTDRILIEKNVSTVEALQTAILGDADGSTPGSARARISGVEKGAIPTANTQTASTATTVVAAATALVRVTYASGTSTLDFAALAVGQMTRVLKANTSAYGFSVKGGASDQVNGGTAGAAMTVPWSTEIGTASCADPSCIVYRDSATSLRVVGASSGLGGGGGGDASSIRGQAVSSTAPTAGQLLVFSGSQYVPKSLFVSQTRDPISTDTGYELGTTWLNSTRSRTWQYIATGEWVCLSDPGLIWEWDPAQGTGQLDLVDETGFTRSTGTFAGSPTTSALIITSTSGVAGNLALTLVKTAQLPPSFWTSNNTFVMCARYANQSAANTLSQLTVPLYYDATHVLACEEAATAGTGIYRNNSASWAGAVSLFSSSVTSASTNGVQRQRRFSFVLPTGSTDPQMTCGGAYDQIGSWYTPILAAPDVSWRGLTNPRVGWGNRAYANASTSVYLGAMKIRRAPNGGA